MSENNVQRVTKELERERWIVIIKTGQGFSQITVLLPEKGASLSHEERQRMRNVADAVRKQRFMNSKNK
jgi:hypothetical protein